MRPLSPANKPVTKRGRILPRFFLPLARWGNVLSGIPFLILGLISCGQSGSKTDISLGADQTFHLLDAESIVPMQHEDLALFEAHFHPRGSEIQMPIYRVIRHPDYTLFLALPLQTPAGRWLARMSHTSEQTVMHLEHDPQQTMAFWNEDSLYLAQYARHPGDRVDWVLCGISRDSGLLRGLLDPDTLSLRISR